MGWGFKKSVKIAPGVRLNLSKRGLSASIGGKGLTYNTRGRMTASLPGTGIRYTTNMLARKSANFSGKPPLGVRAQANADFADNLEERLRKAVMQYFWSHGTYVKSNNIFRALEHIEDQVLASDLQPHVEKIKTAFRLYRDVGSITAANKEKVMCALYALEERLNAALGEERGIEEGLERLKYAYSRIPSKHPRRMVLFSLLVTFFCGWIVATPFAIKTESGWWFLAPFAIWAVWSYLGAKEIWRSTKKSKDRYRGSKCIS